MDELFRFESDFVKSLRCIPMVVRMKLDQCMVKLSLRQWSQLTHSERERLVVQSCQSKPEIEQYKLLLFNIVESRTEHLPQILPNASELLQALSTELPQQVVAFAAEGGLRPPSVEDWAGLSELRRFTLLKLSRDNHDNVNFAPALREFGLLEG